MNREDDPGLTRMREVVCQYDDGVIRTVAARKRMEIAELRLTIGDSEPSRSQRELLRYLDEDAMVYETVAYIMSLPPEEFGPRVEEIAPALKVDFEPVPRSVTDGYRRGLSELELRMEDMAAGYVDDILGILTGTCDY